MRHRRASKGMLPAYRSLLIRFDGDSRFMKLFAVSINGIQDAKQFVSLYRQNRW